MFCCYVSLINFLSTIQFYNSENTFIILMIVLQHLKYQFHDIYFQLESIIIDQSNKAKTKIKQQKQKKNDNINDIYVWHK